MKPESVGSSIIVPMTSSLYVKGTLGEVDKVLVDVGTGYFVEKNIEEADDYFRRKVNSSIHMSRHVLCGKCCHCLCREQSRVRVCVR